MDLFILPAVNFVTSTDDLPCWGDMMLFCSIALIHDAWLTVVCQAAINPLGLVHQTLAMSI